MLQFLQQNPIVIDVAPPALEAPARDISIDVVISIFVLAGMFLLAAAVGSLLVAGAIVLIKRWRDKSPSTEQGHTDPTHTRLRI